MHSSSCASELPSPSVLVKPGSRGWIDCVNATCMKDISMCGLLNVSPPPLFYMAADPWVCKACLSKRHQVAYKYGEEEADWSLKMCMQCATSYHKSPAGYAGNYGWTCSECSGNILSVCLYVVIHASISTPSQEANHSEATQIQCTRCPTTLVH